MSSEYDIVYVQEATEITVEEIEMIKTRLRNWKIGFQQLIMDCNPASDKHPLKLRCNDKRCRLIESRHEDNPRLFDLLPDGTYKVTKQGAKYIAILDALTGVRYKRLRLGLWVSAEGIIYEEFDPAIHILPWFFDEETGERYISEGWEEWERYWVIDWGYVHPFVLKCYAIDPEGRAYMYREIYMTGRIVEEHASQIMSLVTHIEKEEWYDHFNKVTRSREKVVWTEPKPTKVICDHDTQDRKTFERHTGLGTTPAIKYVSEGIDLHKARLKGDKFGPQFFLMADALVERDEDQAQALLPVCTADEYSSYAWKVDASGRKTDQPVKKDDDGVDCDRYLTMDLDFKGRVRLTMIDDLTTEDSLL